MEVKCGRWRRRRSHGLVAKQDVDGSKGDKKDSIRIFEAVSADRVWQRARVRVMEAGGEEMSSVGGLELINEGRVVCRDENVRVSCLQAGAAVSGTAAWPLKTQWIQWASASSCSGS